MQQPVTPKLYVLWLRLLEPALQPCSQLNLCTTGYESAPSVSLCEASAEVLARWTGARFYFGEALSYGVRTLEITASTALRRRVSFQMWKRLLPVSTGAGEVGLSE